MAKRRTSRVRPSRVTTGPLVPDDDDARSHDHAPLDEEPGDADVIRFNDDAVRCRKCKTLLYDDLDVCPRCGEYVTNPEGRRMPWWVLVALGLVVAAFLAPALLPVLARLL